jgi:hypothetical protein
MKYLDQTIDMAFKRLFGNQAHSNIVKGTMPIEQIAQITGLSVDELKKC